MVSSYDASYIPLTAAEESDGFEHSDVNINVTSGALTLRFDGRAHTYSYSYGPKGLAGLRHNHYALLCAILVSIGGLEFGYDQGVVSE